MFMTVTVNQDSLNSDSKDEEYCETNKNNALNMLIVKVIAVYRC